MSKSNPQQPENRATLVVTTPLERLFKRVIDRTEMSVQERREVWAEFWKLTDRFS